MRWHSQAIKGAAVGVVCLLAFTGPGCSVQGYQQDAGGSHSASLGVHAAAQTELSKTDLASEDASISAATFGQREAELLGQSFDAIRSSVIDTWNRYRDHEFRQYEMFGVVRNLINQIDNEEMLTLLRNRGVQLTPEKIFTADNLIAYWKHKKLGTPAVYAWLDLTKGSPDFVQAVQDWQTLRQERGLEFAPTFALLSNAKLTTKKDGEVWADIFKTIFATLSERDGDKKIVMLMCLLGRLPHDLKEIDPPATERIAFLAEEVEKQDVPKQYRQMVLLTLYEASFLARQFAQAGTWAGGLEPTSTGLLLAFIAQVLAKDVDTATATLARIETLTPADENTLVWCRSIVRQLKEMKQKQRSGGVRETTP